MTARHQLLGAGLAVLDDDVGAAAIVCLQHDRPGQQGDRRLLEALAGPQRPGQRQLRQAFGCVSLGGQLVGEGNEARIAVEQLPPQDLFDVAAWTGGVWQVPMHATKVADQPPVAERQQQAGGEQDQAMVQGKARRSPGHVADFLPAESAAGR